MDPDARLPGGKLEFIRGDGYGDDDGDDDDGDDGDDDSGDGYGDLEPFRPQYSSSRYGGLLDDYSLADSSAADSADDASDGDMSAVSDSSDADAELDYGDLEPFRPRYSSSNYYGLLDDYSLADDVDDADDAAADDSSDGGDDQQEDTYANAYSGEPITDVFPSLYFDLYPDYYASEREDDQMMDDSAVAEEGEDQMVDDSAVVAEEEEDQMVDDSAAAADDGDDDDAGGDDGGKEPFVLPINLVEIALGQGEDPYGPVMADDSDDEMAEEEMEDAQSADDMDDDKLEPFVSTIHNKYGPGLQIHGGFGYGYGYGRRPRFGSLYGRHHAIGYGGLVDISGYW